jgi:8-oxo-dGTP diphosphatase
MCCINLLTDNFQKAEWRGTKPSASLFLEFWEEIFDCAKREVLEETGLNIKNIKIGPYTNDIFDQENKHYITLFVVSEYDSWLLQIMEPEKCDIWEWKRKEEIPENLFLPIQNLIKQWCNPFDLIK